MSDPTRLRDETAQLSIEVDGLLQALGHVRAAKGFLDTFPETHKYVKIPEKAITELEKALKPVDKELARRREEARIEHRGRIR